MKIFAFVDVHGNTCALNKIKAKSKKADVVVCAGDLTIFEMNMKQIVAKLAKIKKPVFLVHGNHETEQLLAKTVAPFKNLCYFHKKCKLIGDVLLIGFGGGGFSLVDKNFEGFARKLKKAGNALKVVKVMLVTHAPPYGTKLDLVMGKHCGNKTIRRFIEKTKPALVICGHFHESFGKKDKIRRTKIINPGPEGMMLNIYSKSL